jgi:hypothetical protein
MPYSLLEDVFLGCGCGYSVTAAADPRCGRFVASSALLFFSGERFDTAVDGMDAPHPWRAGAGASRLSYKNATIAVCAFNLLAVSFLLHNYFTSWPRIAGGDQFDSGMVLWPFARNLPKFPIFRQVVWLRDAFGLVPV